MTKYRNIMDHQGDHARKLLDRDDARHIVELVRLVVELIADSIAARRRRRMERRDG